MKSRDKIQHMLITHLIREGQINLQLPDGINLEVGITKDGKSDLAINDDYCWVTASQGDRGAFLDSYGLEMRFSNEAIVVEDELIDEGGNEIHFLDIV